ncbi:lipid-A-disaccharide synthase [Martelella sp. HB161492]|uniref:lipid-A-disaccharide synthase n=1 Tax=Martelella sp. HB161492 TaxID=2720726 RepID=UPI001591746A|nr:lipid-A-disaccharide synthase [Martelella sp. HB161492]
MSAPLKIAVIAGEASGDLLAADAIAEMKQLSDRPIALMGVGGDQLAAQGLQSLYDYSELSVMGFTQVIANLPRLLRRISETASAVIKARPDILFIVDSPDFTHRVARRVRKALPDLPIVQYVCPSVWAWKEYRAREMTAYVDHVLAVLPFEPEAMARLGGPPTTFVGHRLTANPQVVRARQTIRGTDAEGRRTILILPGSRSGEIKSLSPVFADVASILSERGGNYRFITPTVRHRESQVRAAIESWPVKPDIVVGEEAKWQAFAVADAAVAASGTVVLELALAGVPVVSAYKADFIGRFLLKKIVIWSASLPNIIADRPLVPEYFDDTMRAGALARWMELLAAETAQRRVMLDGFATVWKTMLTDVAPGRRAAEILLEYVKA